MKKIQILGTLGLSLLVFSACGTSGEKKEGKVETSVEKIEVNSAEVTEESSGPKDEVTEYNQEILDNESIKVSLIDVKHIKKQEFGNEKYIISFDVENKTDKSITVQARDVSINNRMVDTGLLTMSTDITAGKSATADLEISSFSDDELPKLEGNLEMVLHTYSWDDMDHELDVPVNITFK